MSQFTDPIVTDRKDKKHYKGSPRTKEKSFVSSRICACLFKLTMNLLLWMECLGAFKNNVRKSDELQVE